MDDLDRRNAVLAFDLDDLTDAGDVTVPLGLIRDLGCAESVSDVVAATVSWLPRLLAVESAVISNEQTAPRVTVLDTSMTAPLRCDGVILGSVTVLHPVDEHSGFDRESAGLFLALADVVARQMALRDRVTEANDLAMVDPLTGAANRRAFTTIGDVRLDTWRHEHTPFSLGIVDLDRFKDVNDRFGHAAGDALLKLVVETLQKQSRSGDAVARIGGEEFAVTIVNASEKAAVAAFERIRRTIEALRLPVGSDEVQITASIGVTTVGAADTHVDDLFSRADEALYDAKNAGRNRIAFRAP